MNDKIRMNNGDDFLNRSSNGRINNDSNHNCGNFNDCNSNSRMIDTTHALSSDAHSATAFAKKTIQQIIESGLYRTLNHGHTDGQYIVINGRKMINLCSNDYLGMRHIRKQSNITDTPYDEFSNPAADDVENEQLQIPASSRLLSGSSIAHQMLENALCASKSYESALVYPTGYMANLGIIPVLAGVRYAGSDICKDDDEGGIIFSDALNHASIIDGCRLARGATVITYAHNDTADLESKIAKHDNGRNRRKLIVTEGVFSMDGDLAHLNELSDVARRHGAILAVDDAHGDFVLGTDGRGTPDHLGILQSACRVHVYISSLSKALGSFGGYVASDKSVIDLCINQSRSFIYTSSLPPQIARHAHLRVLDKKTRNLRKKRLEQNVQLLYSALERAGYPTFSKTHIMPITIHDEKKAVRLARHLFSNGIYAPAIRYPTVPRGEARLRISATAWLEDRDISTLYHALESAR